MPTLFDLPTPTLRPLRTRQVNAIDAIRAEIKAGHKRIICQAPTGFGKCHGAGTEVVMYDGSLRKVEDVRTGDILLGPDSGWRKVLNTTCGYGPLYLVTPNKGEPFVCNDVHVLSLKRTRFWHRHGSGGNGKWYGGEIVNIPLDEYLYQSKNFRNQFKLWRVGVSFKEVSQPLDPYFLGVLLGDGSMVTQVGVTTADTEIVDTIYQQANLYGLKVRLARQPDNLSSTFFFHGGGKKCPLRAKLRTLGLHGTKCGEKFIPFLYLASSRKQRLELLAGLIDTDGHVFRNQKAIEFASKSQRMIRDVEFLVRSLGFGCSRSSSVINGVSHYRVHIHGDYTVIPTRIARKQVTKPRMQKKDILVSGFKVEYIGKGYYYGFALDGDSLYLLRDFTVTHNTLLSAHIIQSALRRGKRPMFTAPAINLVNQTLKAFEAEGIRDIGIIQAQHERTDWSQPVQIASVQTLIRRALPEVDFVIIDECFPGETMISTPLGGKRIDTIVPGEKIHSAHGVGCVVSLFRKTHNVLVEVKLSNGELLRCTPDHPIFTKDGWKKAGKLDVGERLFSQENVRALWGGFWPTDNSASEIWGSSRTGINMEREEILRSILSSEIEVEDERGLPCDDKDVSMVQERISSQNFCAEDISRTTVLQSVLFKDREKSYAQPRYERESFNIPEGHKAYSAARWKREADTGYSAAGLGSSRGRMVYGVCNQNIPQACPRIPAPLQARFGPSRGSDMHRTRRRESLLVDSARAGQKKGCALERVWVESIEIKELVSEEPVYNLRVAGHPSYFANGVLVHNCHNVWDALNAILDGDAWKDKIVIGLTATPWTKGMGLRWTSLVVAARTSDLIAEGFLTPFRIFAPAEDADLSKVRTTAGDYNESDLSEAMDKPKLVADVVETWIKRGDNLPTFLFAVDCKHAKSLRDEFESKGIPCGYIDAFSNDDERKETFRRFRSGEDKIIASVGCLVTGIDEDVRCIIDAAPTKSEIKHVQKIGRGLRTAAGKEELLILDHAGNTLRLGMVTDIHHEHLDTRKKGDKGSMADDQPAPKPRKCKECGALMPRGAKACPSCGVAQQEISGVLVERGELVEFGSGKKKPLIEVSKAEKQLWYSGFLHMAIERGRKPGWGAYRYREKFGVWPRGLEHVAYPPTLEMKRFDEHCRIKYAKGRH